MTILQLISSSGYYGAETMLVTLAAAEARHGHTVIVAAFRNSQEPHMEVLESAKHFGLPVDAVLCSGRWDPDVPRRIALLCDRYGVDLLHTHGYKADFYAKAASERWRVPLVATCHSVPGSHPMMQAYSMLDRRILRKFDRVVAVADPVAHILRRSGIPAERVVVIWNGVDVERLATAKPSLRIERGWGTRPVVGFAGRQIEDKGGRVLLKAARMVIDDLPNVMFVIAGEGPARAEWEELTQELGLDANVEFLGAVSDMPEFYASVDVFALPSRDEAMPMSILEASASGRAVVATNVGGIPEAVTEGVTGHLVPKDDAAAVAGALLDLLQDPGKAQRWGEAGRARVREDFSSDTNAAKYLKLYREVLTERKSAGRGIHIATKSKAS